MSPNARTWAINLARIAVTAAALVFVLRMIRFQDYVTVLDSAGKTSSVNRADLKELRRTGTGWELVWPDGRAPTPVVKASEHPGFLSLFERTNKPLFFAMMIAMLATFAFMGLRWWLILRSHGFPVPFGRIFFVTYAGAFFNSFLPGAVGGDLTKAVLASAGEERKAAIAGTVILDRLIGLAVMIVLGAVCLTPFVDRFSDRRLAVLIYGLLGGLVFGYAFYLSPPGRKLIALLPFKKIVAELDEVFRSAWEKKALVGYAAGLSLAGQATGILIIYGLARAMDIPGVGLWMFFIFEPIIWIVTALPISVGGWGVQEYLYQELFGNFGGIDANQAIALSVLYKLSLILVSIPGGVLFALGATKRRAAGASS